MHDLFRSNTRENLLERGSELLRSLERAVRPDIVQIEPVTCARDVACDRINWFLLATISHWSACVQKKGIPKCLLQIG